MGLRTMSHTCSIREGLEMNDKSWLMSEVNRVLIEHYQITFDDTGYEEDEWLARFDDLGDIEASVHAYAEKYGLENIKGFINHPYGC